MKAVQNTHENLKEMFIGCVKKGYEHFGFSGDFTFDFNDTADLTDSDIQRFIDICEVCNSDEFYNQIHSQAVLKGYEDIDIYEQCIKNHFNDGYALPYVKSLRMMGRRSVAIEKILRDELRKFIKYKEELSESDDLQIKNSHKDCFDSIKEDNIKDFIGNRNKEEKFNEAILRLIDMSGKKDSDIYKKGWVSKETFSKVRITGNVSKMTALQLCIALELDIKETKSMLAKAGLTLGNNTSDYIFEFYITKGIYDINMINETLFDNGCKTILKKN